MNEMDLPEAISWVVAFRRALRQKHGPQNEGVLAISRILRELKREPGGAELADTIRTDERRGE